MRRIIAILLCLCLMTALLAGCGGSSIQEYKDGDKAADAAGAAEDEEDAAEEEEGAAEATDAPEDEEPAEDDGDADAAEAGDEAAEDAEPTASPKPGLGYAAYEPDELVLTYDGKEATWREYYYWLNYFAGYIQYMAAMGMPFSGWDGKDFDETLDNASMVRTSAADSLFQYRAVEVLAEQEDLALDEEDQTTLQSSYEQAADSYGDGDGETTEEELTAYEDYLDGQFMDKQLLDYLSGVSMLSAKLSAKLYGEDGSGVSDEDALAYAEELGLLACKHILLMTIDPETNEPLSDEEIAEKKAKADELYEQLTQVQEDPEELEKLFDELMNEFSEDTGLATNPDGYTFASGVMVPVFEDTTSALEEYGLSEPVQSDYGYHIILRLPVDPSGTYTGSNGSETNLRLAAANQKLYELLEQTTEKADIVWQGDFENVDIAEIFGE